MRSRPLRLTRQGWMVLQVATLLLLVGLFKGINLLSLLGFLLLAVVLLNLFLILRQTADLHFYRYRPGSLSVGIPVQLEGRLTSRVHRKRLDLVVVEEGPDDPLAFLIPRMTGTDVVEVNYTWEPLRRGLQPLGPVRAQSRYPFGLIEVQHELLAEEPVIVWPALGEIHRGKLTRQFQRARHRETRGQTPRPERTAQQEIYGLRPFRTGDSTRLIHWRTSARRSELMVREYEDIPPDSLTIVFDATARGPAEQREQALAFTATLCWEWCRHRGERFVLAVAGATCSVLAGSTAPEFGVDLLDLLAVTRIAEPSTAAALLTPLGEQVSRGSGILLISGSPSGLSEVLRRELGLHVLAITAGDLLQLDGYTPPSNLGEFDP